MQQLLTKQEEFSAEKGIKRSLFLKTVPLLLLGVLLVTAFASIFVFADQYGITIDEPNEDAYGQLAFYLCYYSDPLGSAHICAAVGDEAEISHQ